MTLIERLLAQANKESNELAGLLNEAVEALLQAGEEMNQMTDTMIEAVEEMNHPKQEPLGTYESITDIMLHLRNGTIADQQIYEVMKDKHLYTSPPAQKEPVAVVDDAGVIVVCSYKYKPGDKLYTSPPASTATSEDVRLARRPLTGDEITVMAAKAGFTTTMIATDGGAFSRLARAIEAAHGIKHAHE